MQQIVCPQCATAYDVTPAALGAEGRQVRCARCQTVWFAELPEPPTEVTAAMDEARDAPDPAVADRHAIAEDWAAFPENDAATPNSSGDAEPPAGDQGPAASADFDEAAARIAGDDPSATTQDADMTSIAFPDPATIVPVAAAAGLPAAAAPLIDIETSAARESAAELPRPKRPRSRRRYGHWLTAAIIVLAFVNAALIVDRTAVVRALPQTASLFAAIGLPVNLRNLAFRDLKTSRELHDGVDILVIEGKIVATGSAAADVPRLRFAIDTANGREIYAWTALPARNKLEPGETLPFRTRLASPPEQGRTVQIRFFTQLDLAAGLR